MREFFSGCVNKIFEGKIWHFSWEAQYAGQRCMHTYMHSTDAHTQYRSRHIHSTEMRIGQRCMHTYVHIIMHSTDAHTQYRSRHIHSTEMCILALKLVIWTHILVQEYTRTQSHRVVLLSQIRRYTRHHTHAHAHAHAQAQAVTVTVRLMLNGKTVVRISRLALMLSLPPFFFSSGARGWVED